MRQVNTLGDLLRMDYDWSPQVTSMKVPTMLVFADADAILLNTWSSFSSFSEGARRMAA
jgi:hypothetical protein